MSTGGDPMVSVIICTYNRPESLPGALDSVWRRISLTGK